MPHLITLDFRDAWIGRRDFLEFRIKSRTLVRFPSFVLTANAEAFAAARKKLKDVPMLKKPAPIDDLVKQIKSKLASNPISWPVDLTPGRLAIYQGAQRQVEAALVREG